MKEFFAILLVLLISSFNIPVYSKQMPKVKPEVLRAMQNHTFNTGDTDLLWNSVITVLYDSDFIITDIDKDLGYIKAVKTLKANHTNIKRVAGWSVVLAAAGTYTVFSYGATAYYMYSPTRRIANEMRDKTVIIDTNINIEKTDVNKINVKFLPVEKVLQNADGFSFNSMAPVKIIRIYKPQVYNEFFKQVEINMGTI